MFDTATLAPGLLPGVPWSQFEPSGLLADLLATVDVDELDADDALETAAAWEHLIAHAQVQQFRALARFATLRAGTDLDEFGTDEVAPVLHLSRGAADARLHLATRLSTQLPETLAALQSGTIDLPKARAISEATEVLDGPATAAVQARVLTKAPQQTVGELRAALSRAVLAADSDAADHRHRAAHNDRRVQLHPQPDGMGSLWALLRADDATAAYARLDALARDMDADDPRGMDAAAPTSSPTCYWDVTSTVEHTRRSRYRSISMPPRSPVWPTILASSRDSAPSLPRWPGNSPQPPAAGAPR